jgi:PTH1 family peptidyl-tRNA hydrolase
MKMIVGLGNPGPKYETTRHNVGWLALDRLIDRWNASGPQGKNLGEVWTADVKGEKVLLVKPMTFMNASGKCVGPLFQFHKLEAGDLIVIHDELDLKPVSFRLKTGGGAGGHNGLKSIDQFVGADNNAYHRVRIGVGHPRTLNLRIQPADYVLQPFTDTELNGLDPLFDDVAAAIEQMIQGDVLGAMTRYNRRD